MHGQNGRGIAAAFALGAAGVQIGTAYLFTPASLITGLHRDALKSAGDDRTALTNLFSGRPATADATVWNNSIARFNRRAGLLL